MAGPVTSDDAHDEPPADDPALLWRRCVDRICDLVGSLPAQRLEQTVPACPDWTARDLLAHMVGLGADVLAGDEPADHHPEWTQAQVDARRDDDVATLVDEWQGLADDLVALMRREGSRPLNDAVIHEQDLRGALGEPGGDGTAELAVVRGRMADRFASAVDALPPIALIGPSWTWCSAGDAEQAPTQVSAPDLDLFRALCSRRTAQQVRGWTTRGDVEPYLDAFAGLGPLPDEPLPGG